MNTLLIIIAVIVAVVGTGVIIAHQTTKDNKQTYLLSFSIIALFLIGFAGWGIYLSVHEGYPEKQIVFKYILFGEIFLLAGYFLHYVKKFIQSTKSSSGGISASAIFLFLISATAFLFSGCTSKTEKISSPVLYEDAVVQMLIYAPSQHSSGISPGMTMKRKMNVSFTSIDVPAVYGAVFQCQHGNFAIQGSDDAHKNLWKKMKQGATVSVSYKELYQVNYKRTVSVSYKEIDHETYKKNKGEWVEVSRKFLDFEFIDANIKKLPNSN